MFTYIATYAGGIVTGVGLLMWHQYSLRKATERMTDEYRMRRELNRLRAENEELRDVVDARERCDEARSAREQGKVIGMREGRNQSNYERFERAMNPSGGRNIQVGGVGR